MNYYNENDPRAAAWLRELIAAQVIAPGIVDERSITDVKAKDLEGYCQLHFFAGISGWAYALRLAGWPDDRPIWTGSCPCQPFSIAGRGLGEADERHLWPYFRNLIGQRRPVYVVGEQVASPDGRKWLAGVRSQMEAAGYAFGASNLCAAGVGAPHKRQRLYWVAHSTGVKRGEWGGVASRNASSTDSNPAIAGGAGRNPRESSGAPAGHGGPVEPAGSLGRLADMQQPRLEGHAGHGDHRHEPGRERAEAAGSTSESGCVGWLGHTAGDDEWRQWESNQSLRSEVAAGGSGAWSNYEIIDMLDGKKRRIESGSWPLVAGLPKGMVPSGDPSLEEVQASPEFRVARLRGYGNSIVPQLAALFIKAALM